MTIHALPKPQPQSAREATHTLIQRHGALRIIAIAVASFFVRKPSARLPNDYASNRLRRDIGLPPAEPSPEFRRPFF